MLWSEFVEGTGCKDRPENYEVYRNLEAMYMNTNMTKEQVYEYGRKLVDNSPTAEELQLRERLDEEIRSKADDIAYTKGLIERRIENVNRYAENIRFAYDEEDKAQWILWMKEEKSLLAKTRKQLKKLNAELTMLKSSRKAA